MSWKWFLPIAQLALALACEFYNTHEYRAKARADGAVNNPWYFAQHYPALVGRLEKSINFPALVLDYPLRHQTNALYERNSDYTLIWIDGNTLGFFFAIVLFWCWVGWKLDQRQGRGPVTKWPAAVRVAGLRCGVVFGVLTGAYAAWWISRGWTPLLQIGACGMVWSIVLTIYFTRELRLLAPPAPRPRTTPLRA